MDTLFSRHRNAIVLVAVLFLQLVLLAFQIKRDKDVPLIRIWAVGLITPIETVFSGCIRGIGSVWSNYFDLRDARRESLRLSDEVARLKMAHQRLQEEAIEARRLRELLAFREQVASTTVAARVIGSSASETSRVLYLDRGSQDGIRPNSAVITPDGIVGKVYRVFRSSAQVLVITDPDSGVGALLENSRLHGALNGHGGFFCQLRYIVADEKVEVGERVYTSGEDLIYPKGLPIGTVTSVKQNAGAVFKEITVQPSARLNRLEEVLVIIRNVDQEIPSRTETAQAAPAPSQAPTPQAPPAALKPAPAAGAPTMDSARARPETDADKLYEARRQAALKAAGAAPKPSGTATVPAGGQAAPRATGQTGQPAQPAQPGAPPAQGAAKPRPQKPPETETRPQPAPDKDKPSPEPEKPAPRPADPPPPNPVPPPEDLLLE